MSRPSEFENTPFEETHSAEARPDTVRRPFCCRLCLSPSASICILDNVGLAEKIRDCVSINIVPTDCYSKSICAKCLNKIQKWHAFKELCLKSKQVLESLEDDVNNELSIVSKDSAIKCTSTSQLPEVPSETCSRLSDEESNREPVHVCPICSIQFSFYTDFLDHQVEHVGVDLFHCDQCKMSFSNKIELVRHEKQHRVTCEICGIDVQKQSLRLHLNKHTDKFKCAHCQLTFTCDSLLKEHISIRHLKIKQHFCETCGKDFGTRSSLNLHLKTHSDEKNYRCSLCDYAGRTSIALKIHMSKHEKGTYICEMCSKIFKSAKNLRDHLRRVHPADKKHSCRVCGRKFTLRYLLEQHQRTHTGIHPYKCARCDKTFARSDSLKGHIQTHDKSEKFKCQSCSKDFGTKRGMERHNCICDDVP